MKAGSTANFRSAVRVRQYFALLALFLLAVLVAILAPTGANSAAESPVQAANLKQAGKSLILQIRTSRSVNMGKLDRRPDFVSGKDPFLCLEMSRRSSEMTSRICLGGRTRTYRALGISRTTEEGRVQSSKVIRAQVKKVKGKTLVATFDPRDAGLAPGAYTWRIADRGGACPKAGRPGSCLTHFPPEYRAVYNLRPIVAVGCTGGNGEFVTHGPRGRKRVALTFDDGPSEFTPAILRILARKKAKATFFMLGQQAAAQPSLARRVLAQGHEVANHSYDHDLLPSGSNIRHATRTIRQVTGFRPCLFRPPYGARNRPLLRSARGDSMKVVNWDVDTNDWKLPGARKISSTIVNRVRPGSIVLMHDGGGPRGGTVDALEPAISTLKRRGYELVPVTELLGNRVIYQPKPR